MSQNRASSMHVAIACGGTGGHLFPGVAVAEELLREDARVTLMISPKEVDQHAVRELSQVEVVTLPAVAFQQGSRLAFLATLARSVRVCLKLFRQNRPTSVLAMGGFTGAAPIVAARILGIPAFLHESNTVPGRANRLLARMGTRVLVGFPAATRAFGPRAATVGTPVRPRFRPADTSECRRALGLDPDRPVVLVVGGSQGARAINEVVLRTLAGARSLAPRWQWMHLTGPAQESRVRAAYAAEGIDAVVRGFWDAMEVALGAASAAVTRAGASSMAGLAAMCVPAVLVPYPHAAGNHQFHNACAYESTGAAVLVEETDLKPEHLLAALSPMVEDPGVRSRMQAALESWHQPDAASRIAGLVLGPLSGQHAQDSAAPGGTAALTRRNALVA